MEIQSKEQEEKVEQKKPAGEQVPPKRKWGPQIVGAMIGAFIFMVLGGLANQLGWKFGQTNNLWLWGAVLGGFLGAADSLADAGSQLTKSDNKLLNISVSLLGMLVILLIVLGLSNLAGGIVDRFIM